MLYTLHCIFIRAYLGWSIEICYFKLSNTVISIYRNIVRKNIVCDMGLRESKYWMRKSFMGSTPRLTLRKPWSRSLKTFFSSFSDFCCFLQREKVFDCEMTYFKIIKTEKFFVSKENKFYRIDYWRDKWVAVLKATIKKWLLLSRRYLYWETTNRRPGVNFINVKCANFT